MQTDRILSILQDTAYIHTSGTEAEMKCASYLAECCKKLGVAIEIESFPVSMATMREAHLWADGKEIRCTGYYHSGEGTIEAPFVYLPNTDAMSLETIRGKIVLLDTGVGVYTFKDLLDNGAVGFITYNGNTLASDDDIDQKELRSYVSNGKKMLGVNIHVNDAISLVQMKTQNVKITVSQTEYDGQSHNVVASIPGTTDEWIVFTAHYDTTPLSQGSYDNMTGCIGLIEIMEKLVQSGPHRYGARFVFCGSEERGLLGSKAYVQAHEEELKHMALCINLDMIGTIMGRFIACCTSEMRLVDYISYFAAIYGWGIQARQGVYSSDSTPFADKGVPAVSFARLTGPSVATIHNRYDTIDVLSAEQIRKDADFIAIFAKTMVDAVRCPVRKEMPDSVMKDLDDYLGRKKKSEPVK